MSNRLLRVCEFLRVEIITFYITYSSKKFGKAASARARC